jgi:hypothetical protein
VDEQSPEPVCPRWEAKTTAEAAGLTQAERLALTLWADGHTEEAIARQMPGGRCARKALMCGSSKLHSLRVREVRALFKIMRPEYGRDQAPVEDENGRPVTIRARPMTADDYLWPERTTAAQHALAFANR